MNITTVFSPALYPYCKRSEQYICVVVDILRATTTMCTAVEFGAELIPVSSVEEAREYKRKGFLVAGERIERTLDFADFGNSALLFRTDEIKGKTIVHTTTNGTRAIALAQDYKPKQTVIGAFSNINALKDFLVKAGCDVEILLSGWQNTFCLEDTLFAGALSTMLFNEGFTSKDDSTFAAVDLWNAAKEDILQYLEKASHIHRLRKAHFDDVFQYTFTLNTCRCVPVLRNGKIIKA
ncbi:MAG: 2-phosphosulfolactate phosphatase [Bacteroidales bacterium]|nr:2-phosphosulfolactate phosphatase [Bacteroidales bacterium]